jgi:lysophospholipase L1-like esterase
MTVKTWWNVAWVVLAVVAITRLGHGQPVAEAEPAFTLTSKNDPSKPVPGGVRWFGREHQKCLARTRAKDFDMCLLGDSITAMWPGDLFNKYFGKYRAANFGIGGDRCENVLWRLQQGELAGTSPKLIMLLIGTNNQGMNTAEEVAWGVGLVVKRLREVCPESKILLVGILPSRGTPYAKTKQINEATAKFADGTTVRFIDPGLKMLTDDETVEAGVLSDSVHLTPKGYAIWGDGTAEIVAEMMGQ